MGWLGILFQKKFKSFFLILFNNNMFIKSILLLNKCLYLIIKIFYVVVKNISENNKK
jgi:hypothetical protein